MAETLKYQELASQVNDHPNKTRYFEKVALGLLPEFRLVIRGGDLRKDLKTPENNWRNVVEHQLVEAVAIGVLADILKIEQ